MRFPALLLLLALACTDKRAPRPVGIDTLTLPAPSPSADSPDTTALDSLLDSLPVTRVETLVTPVPVVDTSVVILPETTLVIDTTTQPDTTVIVVIDSTPRGVPFGIAGGISVPLPPGLTLTLDSHNAGTILSQLAKARAKRLKVITNMTGGNHANYKTDGAFDMAKWRAKMDTYNTPAIKAAVAQAVADGTLLGNSVMDEPGNVSGASSWGPVGTMNKARVDSMAAYARAIFPTLPMGVALDYRIWPDQRFRELDFLASQYRLSKGPVKAYRDGALALGARDGHQIVFSLNILDGGKPGLPCLIPATGGPGTYSQNCRMTPAQIREFGTVLGPGTCALLTWRYDSGFVHKPENQRAFRDVTAALATEPTTPCRRS